MAQKKKAGTKPRKPEKNDPETKLKFKINHSEELEVVIKKIKAYVDADFKKLEKIWIDIETKKLMGRL